MKKIRGATGKAATEAGDRKETITAKAGIMIAAITASTVLTKGSTVTKAENQNAVCATARIQENTKACTRIDRN